MADLAVIALGLDATGVKKGSDEANKALTDTEKKMDELQKRLDELQKKLKESGKGAEDASKGFKEFGGSLKGAGSALSGLGGPVGDIAGKFQNLQGQLGELIGSFGLVGGAAIGAVAGVAALAAGLTKLTLDGAKLSDQIGDTAATLNVSLDSIQRLQAGFALAGEDFSSFERPLRTLQGLIQEALIKKTGDAAQKLYDLGLSAQTAQKDTGAALISVIVNWNKLRESINGVVATNELMARSTGAITRSQEQLQQTLTGSRPALENNLTLAMLDGVKAGQKLDDQTNTLSHTWNVFTQNLAKGNVGDSISGGLEQATGWVITFDKAIKLMGQSLDFIEDKISGSTYLKVLFGFARIVADPFGSIGKTPQLPVEPGRPHGLAQASLTGRPGEFFDPTVRGPRPPGDVPKGPRESEAEREAKRRAKELADAIKAEEKSNADIRKKGADAFIKDTEDISKTVNDLNAEMKEMGVFLPKIKETTADLLQRLGLPVFAGAAAPPGTAGGIAPGVPKGGATAPDQLLSAREARIQQALSGIFEDFVFQITTARATVGEAFKGLALGVLDTFAAEFAAAFQKSLKKAFIDPLAGWLEDALSEMFSGISGKGLGRFFKAIGTSFVGLFAEGGTIPSNHWGIVGERGPEIAFAGSTPMQIAPMGGGGAISVNMNFAISTPTGDVSQRTQDQIADAAARGIERAQRLRGAR